MSLTVPAYQPGTQPQLFDLESLQLSQIRIGALKAALIEFKAPNVDIVLGANFFQDKIVCLDPARQVGGIR